MNETGNETPINEAIPTKNYFFTIDPYTSIDQYNEALHALDNNKIKYTEWVSTLQPYNFFLWLEGNQTPLMMNYDVMNSTDWTKVVSKVQPLQSNDIVRLYRRTNKQSDISQYINNDAFNYALKQPKTIVFQYRNKESLMSLSKSYGRIYPLGRYMNGGKRLAMCFDPGIKNVLIPSEILLEIGKHKVGELEVKINYTVLRNHDKIQKWSKTPRFEDGKFIPTSPVSPLSI